MEYKMKEENHLSTHRRSRNTSYAPVRTMNLVFFTHPDFLGHASMPRFFGNAGGRYEKARA